MNGYIVIDPNFCSLWDIHGLPPFGFIIYEYASMIYSPQDANFSILQTTN